MTLYSGTSRQWYDIMQGLMYKFPVPRKISCWNSEWRGGEEAAFRDAISFARKRARQDHSEPVVIEITRLSDFEIVQQASNVTIIKGILSEGNHKLHEIK